MSPELFKAAVEYFTPHEGNIPWLYQCVHGWPTVGRGHLVPSADASARLAWTRQDRTIAGTNEIRAEWDRIKALPAGKRAEFYRQHAKLRLTQERIDALFRADVLEAERILRETKRDGAAIFPDYDRWPLPAQLAMIDMIFSLGPAMLGSTPPKAYPKLVAAAQRGNWETCADESGRGGVSKTRDAAVRALFMEASRQWKLARPTR
jgi:GH24 family phage-related lysozyme (muramidase)